MWSIYIYSMSIQYRHRWRLYRHLSEIDSPLNKVMGKKVKVIKNYPSEVPSNLSQPFFYLSDISHSEVSHNPKASEVSICHEARGRRDGELA